MLFGWATTMDMLAGMYCVDWLRLDEMVLCGCSHGGKNLERPYGVTKVYGSTL